LELETNEFVNSNQILKQKDLSKFFFKSNFDFESVLILGKELHPGFGSCPRRRKGKLSRRVSCARWAGLSDAGLSMGITQQGAHGAA
jgi:hypothetical protein